MALTIASELIIEIKKHLRIFHNEDDSLIKNEINVSILNIYSHFLKKKVPDNFKTKPNELDERILLAIKHMVTMYRENPDGLQLANSRMKIIDKRIIERTLGSLMNLIGKDF